MNPEALCRGIGLAARVVFAAIVAASGIPSKASLVYSTYLGGSSDEGAAGVAVDSAGNAYVVGTTSSADFPSTTGKQLQGGYKAYVVKFSPTGALLYATYVGECSTQGNAIAVDDSGNAYITGRSTYCSADESVDGVLVAKLDPAGALIYQHTFGTSLADTSAGYGIAVDAQGSAYVTGKASAGDFPTTAGAFQTTDRGAWRAGFVAKLNPAGDALLYSTYLCGTWSDTQTAIAVDSAGNAYIAGTTASHDFPTVNAYQPTHRGGPTGDTGFVCKLNPNGSQLIYSTYLGGTIGDSVTGIAVDREGNAYVTGGTAGGDFPTTPGVVQPTSPFAICAVSLCSDAFVTRFSPEGSVLYSTFVAGEGHEGGSGIVVDQDGNVSIAGTVSSGNFPIRNAVQRDNRGREDVFITKLNRDASRILFSTYLGGGKPGDPYTLTEGSDKASGLALGPDGSVYVAGYSTSLNFPTTDGVFQPKANGGFCYLSQYLCGDAFVSRVDMDAPGDIPALRLDVTPAELAQGGMISATWAGIAEPTVKDQLFLYPLGERSDDNSVRAAYPTEGAAAGTLTLQLPDTLLPGTYELRLMTVDPDYPALLHAIARSGPITVRKTTGLARLVLAMDGADLLRLRLEDPSTDNYNVEVTETLNPPNWRAIGAVNGQLEFSEKVNPTAQSRYYRVSKP